MSIWADITKDPKTGHTVARDFFKAMAFAGALAWGTVMAYLKFRGDKDLTAEPMYALLAYSGGLQYIKARQTSGTGLPVMGASEPPAGPPPPPPPDAEETGIPPSKQETGASSATT